MYYVVYLILLAIPMQQAVISAPPTDGAEAVVVDAAAAEPAPVDPTSPEAFTARAKEDEIFIRALKSGIAANQEKTSLEAAPKVAKEPYKPKVRQPRALNLSLITPDAGISIESLKGVIPGAQEVLAKRPKVTYIQLPNGEYRELHDLPTATVEKSLHSLADTSSTVRTMGEPATKLYEFYDLATPYVSPMPTGVQETSVRLSNTTKIIQQIEENKIWYTTHTSPQKKLIDLTLLQDLINTQTPFKLFEEETLPQATADNIVPVTVDINHQFSKRIRGQKETFDMVKDPLLIKIPDLDKILSTYLSNFVKPFIPLPMLQELLDNSGLIPEIVKGALGITDFALDFTQYKKLDITSAKKIMLNIPIIKKQISGFVLKKIKENAESMRTISDAQNTFPGIAASTTIEELETKITEEWLTNDNIEEFLRLDSIIGKNISYHVNAPPEYVAINNPYRKYVLLTAQKKLTQLINSFCEGKEYCAILSSKHPNQTSEQYTLAAEHNYLKHISSDTAPVAIAERTMTPKKGERHYLKIDNTLVPFWWTETKELSDVDDEPIGAISTQIISETEKTTHRMFALASLQKAPKKLENETIFYINPSSFGLNQGIAAAMPLLEGLLGQQLTQMASGFAQTLTPSAELWKTLTAEAEVYTLKPFITMHDFLSSPAIDSLLLVKKIPLFSSLYSSKEPADADKQLRLAINTSLHEMREFFNEEKNKKSFFEETYPSFIKSLPPTIGGIQDWIAKYTSFSFITDEMITNLIQSIMKRYFDSIKEAIFTEDIKLAIPLAIAGTDQDSETGDQWSEKIENAVTNMIASLSENFPAIKSLPTINLLTQDGVKDIFKNLFSAEDLASNIISDLKEEGISIPELTRDMTSICQDILTNLPGTLLEPLKLKLPKSLSPEELENPSTQEIKNKIITAITSLSHYLLTLLREQTSGVITTYLKTHIPQEFLNATRHQFYTIESISAATETATELKEIEEYRIDGIKQLFLKKSKEDATDDGTLKALTLIEKKDAIEDLDQRFAEEFNTNLETTFSEATRDNKTGDDTEAITLYVRSWYQTHKKELSPTSQELIAHARDAFSQPNKKIAYLIERYTKYQNSVEAYRAYILIPDHTASDLSTLKAKMKDDKNALVEMLSTYAQEELFFIDSADLEIYKEEIESLAAVLTSKENPTDEEFMYLFTTAIKDPLAKLETLQKTTQKYQLSTVKRVNQAADECLKKVFTESDITVTAPHALSELEPISDASKAKLKPTYHFDYKSLAAKTVRVSLAAKLCQYFVKERNEFVVDELMKNAETFAGLLAPSAKPTKAKTALITQQLKKLCCFAPLKISLNGGFKHTLLYLLFYELICYLETQIQDQSITRELFGQLGEFLSKNSASSVTAFKTGNNPFTTFEKDFLRKLAFAGNSITHTDTKLPPIPLTWLGHALLGSFNPIRATEGMLENITSKEFIDTPMLAWLMNKNIFLGGFVMLKSSPERLKRLNENSLVKQILPFLRGTPLVPNFYQAPWFICLKKFFIGFLTVRNI